MTEIEKILATALIANTEKTINLEDNQVALVKLVAASLPLPPEQKRVLLDSVARIESANDHSRASLEELKTLLGQN